MNYIRIGFTDLSFEKQEELIKFIKPRLLAEAKEEAEQMRLRAGHDNEKTWQETYCIAYSIDWDFADEKDHDWEMALDDYLTEKAAEKIDTALRGVAIEI